MGTSEQSPVPFRKILWERRDGNFRIDSFLSDGVFNDQVFRFVSLRRFIADLRRSELQFSDPETWIDPYERLRIQSFRSFTDENVRAKILCFTTETHSEALWKVYRRHPHERFVRYQLSFSGLLAEVALWRDAVEWKTYCAAVQYGDRTQLDATQLDLKLEKKVSRRLAGAYSYKLRAFSYERELRLIRTTRSTIPTGPTGFKVDWGRLLKGVLIDPTATEAQKIAIEGELAPLLPPGVKVSRSDLYLHPSVEPLTRLPINSVCPRTGGAVSRTSTAEYRGLTVAFSSDELRDDFLSRRNECEEDRHHFDVLIREYDLDDGEDTARTSTSEEKVPGIIRGA